MIPNRLWCLKFNFRSKARSVSFICVEFYAECGYYILFIIFGLIRFTGWYKLRVLHLPTLIVFIRSTLDFFSLNENKKLNSLFAKYDIFLHFSFSLSLQPRVNDPLFKYHFRILE